MQCHQRKLLVVACLTWLHGLYHSLGSSNGHDRPGLHMMLALEALHFNAGSHAMPATAQDLSEPSKMQEARSLLV